jgi:hypothetical protein
MVDKIAYRPAAGAENAPKWLNLLRHFDSSHKKAASRRMKAGGDLSIRNPGT